MKRRRCCLAKSVSGWWIDSDGSGPLTSRFRDSIPASEMGEGSLRIAVHYSAVNYKDALALTGSPGVVRKPPLIPGIDSAGVVEESSHSALPEGTPVVITGYGYGENRHGGLATAVMAEPEHVIALPPELSLHHAATLGTAGITAGLAVAALQRNGVTPESSALPIAVTGAAGGVGSFALALLSAAGYSSVAITGRVEESSYLTTLGATEVLSRDEFLTLPQRPLLGERFAGAIDQAGGDMLATLLSCVETDGVVAACGLAASADLPTTVLPFILRGVSLVGINSVFQTQAVRQDLWNHFAATVDSLHCDEIAEDIPLDKALEIAPRVLSGRTRGRVVVRVRD